MTLHGQAKRDYQRAWVAERKAEWFEGKICVMCQTQENLELHHVDRETKVSHSIWSWSEERREEELAKCEVLCNTCHKAVSAVQMAAKKERYPHGNRTKYRYGCRCEECSDAQKVYMKQYKSLADVV